MRWTAKRHSVEATATNSRRMRSATRGVELLPSAACPPLVAGSFRSMPDRGCTRRAKSRRTRSGPLEAEPPGSENRPMAGSADLEQRLSFVGLRAEDLEALRSLRGPLEKHADAFVGAFYRHLLSFQPTRDLLRDAEVKN